MVSSFLCSVYHDIFRIQCDFGKAWIFPASKSVLAVARPWAGHFAVACAWMYVLESCIVKAAASCGGSASSPAITSIRPFA